MKTALVIGGTGMLAGLVKKLSDQFDTVGVVGRTQTKMQSVQSFSEKIIPVMVDYTDTTALTKSLDTFVKTYGRPELVVSWIHSTSPEAHMIVAGYCTDEFYDITGHGGTNPDHPSRQREKAIRAKGLTYHRVILGQVGDRWLTDQEISNGV